MSIEPSPRSKTIDDLGIETSIRYAKDQQVFDRSIVSQAGKISTQTKVEVSTLAFASEFETLFETTERNKGWALFERPPHYFIQSNILFSYQMIPSLGGDENLVFIKQRIRDKLEKERKKKGQKNQAPYEQEIELKENEEESSKLIAFLDILEQLDQMLIQINSKRSQYQKG